MQDKQRTMKRERDKVKIKPLSLNCQGARRMPGKGQRKKRTLQNKYCSSDQETKNDAEMRNKEMIKVMH